MSVVTRLIALHQRDPRQALALAVTLEETYPGISKDVAHWSRLFRQTCPECGGDGYLTCVGGPGYFSEAMGCYLPNDVLKVCPVCDGRGWKEAGQ